MSERIKDAFQRVKDDITSINMKIDGSEKKKIIVEQELAVIKQKMILEEELKDEFGNMLRQMKQSMTSIRELKDEFNEQINNVEGLIKGSKQEFKLETKKINGKIEEVESQIEEGVISMSEPLKKLLKNVEKKTKKQELEQIKALEKKVVKEKKSTRKTAKKGLFTKLVNSLSDE